MWFGRCAFLALYHLPNHPLTCCIIVGEKENTFADKACWLDACLATHGIIAFEAHYSVIYEYQKGRDHHIPLEFYKDYKGVLVTDGLSQYHLVDKKLPDVINANCWAHARRDYADAIKAADKSNPAALKNSIAHQALERIAKFYEEDGKLKDLPSEERLQKYLKVFLDHPDVPIDNSASERAIRTFCLGKKNWMFHNTANGANSSALVYSISETAKLN